MDAVESVAAETLFGEYTVDASFVRRGVESGGTTQSADFVCTRREKRAKRKRERRAKARCGWSER